MSRAEFDAETRRLRLKVREVPPEQPRIVRPWWELRSNGYPPATRRQLIGAPWWDTLLTTEEGRQMLRDTQDEDPLQEAADEAEERLRAQLQSRRDRRGKRCYKCHDYGHVRAKCPNRRRPWSARL